MASVRLNAPFITAAPTLPPYAVAARTTTDITVQPDISQAPVAMHSFPTDQPTASTAAPVILPTPVTVSQARAIASHYDDDENEDSDAWRPRVISWNGHVTGERILRIELPNRPGRVEIPRAYRQRVGIVEPPQPDNEWRCVRLRVIGNGFVSLVIRWWPRS